MQLSKNCWEPCFLLPQMASTIESKSKRTKAQCIQASAWLRRYCAFVIKDLTDGCIGITIKGE